MQKKKRLQKSTECTTCRIYWETPISLGYIFLMLMPKLHWNPQFYNNQQVGRETQTNSYLESLLAADNNWHVVWPQNLWLSVMSIMYSTTFREKNKARGFILGRDASGKFSIPSNKCLLLISTYTAPAEWVGWKHIDIVVALHRCRLALRVFQFDSFPYPSENSNSQ